MKKLVVMLLALLAMAVGADAAVKYEVIDLGIQDGYLSSLATGINESGQIVGYNWKSDYEAIAFAWDSINGMTSLGDLGGGGSAAHAINNNGQIVGVSLNTNGNQEAFTWDSVNGMVGLGDFGGKYSIAEDINDNGVIVGSSVTLSGQTEGFVYDPVEGMQVFNAYGTSSTKIRGINNNGLITGVGTNIDGDNKAFIFDITDGLTVTEIDTVGVSFGNKINDNGIVSGWTAMSNGLPEGFISDGVTITKVGILGSTSNLFSINNDGQAVGYDLVNGSDERGLYFDGELGLVYLDDLIDPASGWAMGQARSINNNGMIVGQATNSLGEVHAVLLNPVPEPATLSMVALGGLALLRRKK